MTDSAKGLTRGKFVQATIVLPALLAAGALPAQAKGSKAQFKYQTTPNSGHQCSQCTFFTAGSSATANGTCKIVDGAISPKGWCTAFSAKTS
jgi:hypothetical protein